jgi:hypothetical protein
VRVIWEEIEMIDYHAGVFDRIEVQDGFLAAFSNQWSHQMALHVFI